LREFVLTVLVLCMLRLEYKHVLVTKVHIFVIFIMPELSFPQVSNVVGVMCLTVLTYLIYNMWATGHLIINVNVLSNSNQHP
jgi:hypothetical protein